MGILFEAGILSREMRRPILIVLGALAALLALALPRSLRSEPTLEELRPAIPRAVSWVEGQRKLHRPQGRPLSKTERRALDPFFPKGLLEQTRIATAPRITNPPFVEDFGRRADGSLLYDMRGASGIAFIDTVVVVESRTQPGTRRWIGLLFHELVHLTQYRTLGTEGFVRGYIESMVQVGFDYPAIAHEAQAYSLQGRFRHHPDEAFSVEEEVRERFPSGASPTS